MSTATTSTAPTSTSTTGTTTAPARFRRPVRIGTIVWGAILVAVAAFTLLLVFGGPLSAAAILWSIVGFGILLVLAALAAGVARAVRNRPAPAIDTEEIAEDHPPIG